jgi:L-ribulose-5-phosphate 3-epimerase
MAIELAICSKVFQEHPLVEAVELAATIGYTGMALFAVPGHLPLEVSEAQVEQAARVLEKSGVQAVGIWTYLGYFAQESDAKCEADLETLGRYLDIAEALDCDMVRVIPGGPDLPRDAREDHWERAAHYLTEGCDRALGRGIGLVLDNNHGLTATVDGALELLSRVDRPNLGLNYDPGNLYRYGKYYAVEALERCGDHVWTMQAKDAARSSEGDRWQLPLGEGELDYGAIFEWLVDNDWEGVVIAEGAPGSLPAGEDRARAKRDYQALRRLLQAAGVETV